MRRPARIAQAETPSPRARSARTPAPTGSADRVVQEFDGRGLFSRTDLEHLGPRSTAPSLISDYDGTPIPYGNGPREHLRALDS
ncbi:hypothetical protein [Streptomyces sp. NPDC014623]|uniref:hypothetical protein n=1 Tax=Streptomyces sp. NPDC014623 TaxID=3364875 RepID=UPI0037013A2C